MPQVPVVFALHLISTLEVPTNGIAEVSHWRSPKLMKSTRRFSYKVAEYDTLRKSLEEQKTIEVKKEMHFVNGEVSSQDSHNRNKSADEILEEAVASSSFEQPRSKETRSMISVSCCEGRLSREAEFIWYPNLYSDDVQFGKLELRIFVNKTSNI